DLEARLVAGRLRDRGLIGRGQPAVRIDGGAIEQELRGIELDRHLGELPLQPLEFAERAAELLARQRMLTRALRGIASERQRTRGVAEPLDVEGRDLLLEAAGAEQHVLGRDATIVEMQLGPLLATHEAGWLADRETWRAALDDHRADAAKARSIAQIDEKDLGIRTESREPLRAVDDVMRAVLPGAGDEIGDRGTSIGLAHPEADHHVAGKEPLEPALLLCRRRIFGESTDRAEIAELH